MSIFCLQELQGTWIIFQKDVQVATHIDAR